MSTRHRIPSTLEPYLRLPPEAALILLTGTLACSANWLTARFAGSLLSTQNLKPDSTADGRQGADREAAVVFVSFMREAGFWKNELRRTMVRILSTWSEVGG
jgi:elongator complex protein 6